MGEVSSKALIVAGVSLLFGCGGGLPPTAKNPPPSAAKTGRFERTTKQDDFEAESLARLRALRVFSVDSLVAGQPVETFSCYGPCTKLGQLVLLAENESTKPAPPGSCESKAIEQNLAAVEDLKVVHLDGLVKGTDEQKCERAGKLANIAAGLKTLR